MRTRVLFLGVLWLAPLALTAACGDVEKCRRGDPGCVDGFSDDEGECRFGLVRDRQTDICVEPSADGGTDQQPEDPNAACGSCREGFACRPSDGQCVNVCEQPGAVQTGLPSLPNCRPIMNSMVNEPAFDFTAAAVRLCKQGCARRAALCPGAACNPEVDCAPAAALVIATALCPGMAAECAMTACERVRDTDCAQQQCPGNAAPNCAGVTCTDSCGDGEDSLNYDGVCDDGELSNAISAICPFGTDCGDCGPRRGAVPPAQKVIGQQCIDPYQCGASYEDFSNVPAWCVVVDRQTGVERCVPDCSTSGVCPAGYQCEQLKYENDTGMETPLKDARGVIGSACFPMQCGN